MSYWELCLFVTIMLSGKWVFMRHFLYKYKQTNKQNVSGLVEWDGVVGV